MTGTGISIAAVNAQKRQKPDAGKQVNPLKIIGVCVADFGIAETIGRAKTPANTDFA